MTSTSSEREAADLRPPWTRPSAADWPELAHRELVSRIVVSPTFARSERLSTLLRYVCDMRLKGREAEINEQKIGQAVFGRPPDYDSAIDGIVRTQASRLRQRLDLYFQKEGVHEPVRIVIPRGGYVPVFETRLVAEPPASERHSFPSPAGLPVGTTSAVVPRAARRIWPAGLVFSVLLAAILGALALGLVADRGHLQHRILARVHPSPSERLWKMMFAPDQPTLLVVGDGGANMYENISRKPLSAEQYASDSWAAEPEAQTPPGYNWVPIVRRNYTPPFAVNVAANLARLSDEVSDGQLAVLSARDLRLGDLKVSQAILLGGENYDPWEQLLSSNRNFRYTYDPKENSVSIYNEHPEAGEASVYMWKQSDPNPVAGYALVTLTHNLNGTGRILLLQGTTAQGDEAAADFVLDEASFNPLLARAIQKNGQINDFEALLETKFVGGGNVGASIAAFRVHPPGTPIPVSGLKHDPSYP